MESLKKLEEQKPYVDAYIPDSKYQSKQDGKTTPLSIRNTLATTQIKMCISAQIKKSLPSDIEG